MALPTTNLGFSDINTIGFNVASNTTRSLADCYGFASNVPTSGLIDLGSLRGKVRVVNPSSLSPYYYYPFDGNLNETVRAVNGVNNGSAVSYPAGKRNQCLSLALNTPSTSAAQFISASTTNPFNPISISLWIQVLGLPSTAEPNVVVSIFPFKLYIANSGGVYIINHNLLTSTGWAGWNASYTPVINTWFHYAWTYSAGVSRIYINGALNTTFNSTGTTASASGMTIGTDGLARAFKGLIDDFAIFDRVLTASEVQSLAAL